VNGEPAVSLVRSRAVVAPIQCIQVSVGWDQLDRIEQGEGRIGFEDALFSITGLCGQVFARG
jgi:hypothetical protein